jgi:hypothetical protein
MCYRGLYHAYDTVSEPYGWTDHTKIMHVRAGENLPHVDARETVFLACSTRVQSQRVKFVESGGST